MSLLLTLLFLTSFVSISSGQSARVVAFIGDWTGVTPDDIRWAQITHLIYSFAIPDESGNIAETFNAARMKTFADEAKKRGVKVLLGVGGGDGSGNFVTIAANAQTRQRFANNLLQVCKTNNLAGVDIDWEHPDEETATHYLNLMRTVSQTLRPNGLLLCTDVPPGQWRGQFFLPEVFNLLDFFNVMAYDFTGSWDMSNPGQHSSYDDAIGAVKYWTTTRGIDTSKANFGLPFYGKDFSTVTGAHGIMWRNIVRDHPDLSPATNQVGDLWFNGPQLIAQKCRYVINQGIGGVMIWEYTQDSTTRLSLLDAVSSVLGSRDGKKRTLEGVVEEESNDHYVMEDGSGERVKSSGMDEQKWTHAVLGGAIGGVGVVMIIAVIVGVAVLIKRRRTASDSIDLSPSSSATAADSSPLFRQQTESV